MVSLLLLSSSNGVTLKNNKLPFTAKGKQQPGDPGQKEVVLGAQLPARDLHTTSKILRSQDSTSYRLE